MLRWTLFSHENSKTRAAGERKSRLAGWQNFFFLLAVTLLCWLNWGEREPWRTDTTAPPPPPLFSNKVKRKNYYYEMERRERGCFFSLDILNILLDIFVSKYICERFFIEPSALVTAAAMKTRVMWCCCRRHILPLCVIHPSGIQAKLIPPTDNNKGNPGSFGMLLLLGEWGIKCGVSCRASCGAVEAGEGNKQRNGGWW